MLEQPLSLYKAEAGDFQLRTQPDTYPVLNNSVSLFVETISPREILVGFINADPKDTVQINNDVFAAIGRESYRIEETNLVGSESKQERNEMRPTFNKLLQREKTALSDYANKGILLR